MLSLLFEKHPDKHRHHGHQGTLSQCRGPHQLHRNHSRTSRSIMRNGIFIRCKFQLSSTVRVPEHSVHPQVHCQDPDRTQLSLVWMASNLLKCALVCLFN
ncbi:hypothetical protein BGZ63DRAFT_195842 [Mariannaea sp. PMI_226]|nr:hypothetical protein BGZ63DRAFT_195842 [Mariannaea sp. PMI_226]